MKGSSAFLLFAVAAAMPAPAGAQPDAVAWTSCLRSPAKATDLVADCTVVIESARATPAERAAALNNRGAELGFRGASPEQALRDLDRAIVLLPEVARLYNTRGTLRAAAGDTAGALADFGMAIRLDPKFAVAYARRGELLLAERRFDEAMRDLDEAIRLAPAYVHPLYNPYESRAAVREARGDAAGAAADRRTGAQKLAAANPSVAAAPAVSGPRSWDPWMSP